MDAGRPRGQAMQAEGFDDAPLRHYAGQLLRDRRQALRQAATTPEEAKRWSQSGVAARLGTTKQTVSAFERGERWPYCDRVLLYAHLLGIPYAHLLPQPRETAATRLVARLLVAPPYVQAVISSILDMGGTASRRRSVDVS